MISLSIEGGIAIVTLCRPPVDAINEEWVARLDEILEQVEGSGRLLAMAETQTRVRRFLDKK